MKRILSSAVVIAIALLVAPAAFADLTFVGPGDPGYQVYQQQENSPCVIGDNSCKQGGFKYLAANGVGAIDQYDAASPDYTLAELQAVIGLGVTTFSIGIDDNVAQGKGTDGLVAFKLWACLSGCTSFAGAYTTDFPQTSPVPSGYTTLVTQFVPTSPATYQPISFVNGNGESDALLTGFDLSGLSSDTHFIFEAIVKPSSDGMEEFFLISAATSTVPEPASIALLGTVLIAAGHLVRNRRRA